MSKWKSVVPGSPFQFLTPGEQLAPLMKDVKVAQITYDPYYYGPGRGLLRSVLDNLNGRVHRRLCPFVEISYVRSNLNGPAILEMDYGDDVKKKLVLNHPNIRLLMKEVYDFRQEEKLMSNVVQSLTTYQENTIDDMQDTTPQKKSKKAFKKK